MKELTNMPKNEFENLIDEGCGYSHFMGGNSSKNGKEIIDSHLGLFLFEKDEVGNEFYLKCIEAQQEDAEVYLDTYWENNA